MADVDELAVLASLSAENVGESKRLLQDAVSGHPRSALLLAKLASLCGGHEAEKLLRDATDRVNEPEYVWMALAQLDERRGLSPSSTVETGLSKLAQRGAISRATWIRCAIQSERSGYPACAKAIINVTSQVGLKHEEMESEWSREFDQCIVENAINTARHVLQNATDTLPANTNLWRKWVQFEKQHGTRDVLQEVASNAVKNIPSLEPELSIYYRQSTELPRYNSPSSMILLSPPPPPGSSISAVSMIESDNRRSTDEDAESLSINAQTTTKKSAGVPGLTGLQNLGNTCFMNSSLQCMSNTQALSLGYFLKGYYKNEINRENPLGMKGAIADVFGELMEQMWNVRETDSGNNMYSSSRKITAPRKFKMTISNFAPQFTGYAQHDSQELLAFLLDGLHEDLNRVKKKPYIEARDNEGRSDNVIATEQWEIHKARNNSIIVDLFQGQYKSRLVCDVCNMVSIKFDPFMYLTLPIPVKNDLYIEKITFVPRDPLCSVQLMKRLALPSDAEPTIKLLKSEVGRLHGVEPDRLVVAEVFQDAVYKVYADEDSAGDISPSDDVYIWELDQPVKPIPSNYQRRLGAAVSDYVAVLINHKRNTSNATYTFSRNNTFGIPLAIVVAAKPDVLSPSPQQQNYTSHRLWKMAALQHTRDWIKHIQVEVLRAMKRWTTFDFELWVQQQIESRVQNPKSIVEINPQKVHQDGSQNGSTLAAHNFIDEGVVATTGRNPTQNNFAVAVSNLIELDADHSYSNKVSVSNNIESHSPMEQTSPKKSDDSDDNDDELLLEKSDPSLDYGTIFKMHGSSEGMSSSLQPVPSSLTHGSVLVALWSEEVYERVLTPENRSTRSDVLGHGKWQEYQFFTPPVRSNSPHEVKKDGPITLDRCLDEFMKEEHLSESDPWYCGHCKAHQQACKKFDLWQMPDILVVHLKRFSQRGLRREKLDVAIDFPIKGLDLTQRVQSAHPNSACNLIYDLYAVSNHYGGLGGGHYTAYAMNPIDQQWYDFDDSNVSPISSDRVVSANAYVLFYQRRDMEMPVFSYPSSEPSTTSTTVNVPSHSQSFSPTSMFNNEHTNIVSSSSATVDSDAMSVSSSHYMDLDDADLQKYTSLYDRANDEVVEIQANETVQHLSTSRTPGK